MNSLTSTLSVFIKSVWYKCFAWPTIMLGIDANGNPQPFGVGTPSGGGGGGIPVTPQSVTQQPSVIVPASTSQVIPIGAKEWTVSVLTGTATVNGAAGCPAGFSDGSTQTLLNTVTITTAATSTAYVRWAT